MTIERSHPKYDRTNREYSMLLTIDGVTLVWFYAPSHQELIDDVDAYVYNQLKRHG